MSIVVSDTDHLLLTGNAIVDGVSMFERVLLVFTGAKGILHQFVNGEVRDEQSRQNLDHLMKKGLVEVWDDHRLLTMLVQAGDPEETACDFYQRTLAECIDSIDHLPDQPNPRNIYRNVLDQHFDTVSMLLKELTVIESHDLSGCSIGELKSAVMIQIMLRVGLTDIKLFTANDRAACEMVVRVTGEVVACASVAGSFVMLFKHGVPMDIAEKYLHQIEKRLGTNDRFFVEMESDGTRKQVRTTYAKAFEYIYLGQAEMLVNGTLLIRK